MNALKIARTHTGKLFAGFRIDARRGDNWNQSVREGARDLHAEQLFAAISDGREYVVRTWEYADEGFDPESREGRLLTIITLANAEDAEVGEFVALRALPFTLHNEIVVESGRHFHRRGHRVGSDTAAPYEYWERTS